MPLVRISSGVAEDAGFALDVVEEVMDVAVHPVFGLSGADHAGKVRGKPGIRHVSMILRIDRARRRCVVGQHHRLAVEWLHQLGFDECPALPVPTEKLLDRDEAGLAFLAFIRASDFTEVRDLARANVEGLL